jgi:hypothetical protein
MKIKLTILALLSLAATAMAGDAEMKRQLIGTWTASSDDEVFVLTSDGRFIISDGTEQQWDVRGGNFIEIRPSPESERNYTIRSLTKHKCVIQENGHDDGIGIWTKITTAQVNRPVLQPQDTGQYDSGRQESQRQPPPSNEKLPVILNLDRALNDQDWSAPTRKAALAAFDQFIAGYQIKFPKDCECLAKDKKRCLPFTTFQSSTGRIYGPPTPSNQLLLPSDCELSELKVAVQESQP